MINYLGNKVITHAEIKKTLKKEIVVINSLFNPELDGYTIKMSNLDLTKEGIYQVIYQDSYTNIIYEKEIEVITLEKLKKEGICNINLESIKNLTYSYIDKITTKNDTVVSLVKLDKFDYRIYIENDNTKILSGKVFNDTPCEFFCLGYLESTGYIYVAGYGDYIGTGLDNICVVMDLNGNIISSRKIIGWNMDVSTSIKWDGEMFWYAGYTTTFTNIYTHDTKGTDAYVLGYDPVAQMTYYLDLAREGIDTITYLNVDSSGIFAHHISNNNNNYVNYLTYIDYEANFTTYNLNINQELKIIDTYENQEGFYVFGKYETIDEDKTLYNNYLYYIDKVTDSVTGVFGYLDNDFYALNMLYKNNQLFLFYTNADNQIVVQIYDLLQNKVIFEKKVNTVNSIIEVFDEDDMFKCRTSSEVYYLDIQFLTYENELKYNNQIVTPLITYNENEHLIFGNYEVIYDQSFVEFDFYYYRNDEIELVCNISNNNTYQKDFCLSCNGDVYLDGNQIANNTLISSLGNHILTIKGHDIDDVVINFKIVDVIKIQESDVSYELEPNFELNLTNISPVVNNNVILEDGEFTESLSTKDESETLWYLLIPCITGLSTIIFFNVVGKK